MTRTKIILFIYIINW